MGCLQELALIESLGKSLELNSLGLGPGQDQGERQDLGSLASDPVSRTNSFALGDFLS